MYMILTNYMEQSPS